MWITVMAKATKNDLNLVKVQKFNLKIQFGQFIGYTFNQTTTDQII